MTQGQGILPSKGHAVGIGDAVHTDPKSITALEGGGGAKSVFQVNMTSKQFRLGIMHLGPKQMDPRAAGEPPTVRSNTPHGNSCDASQSKTQGFRHMLIGLSEEVQNRGIGQAGAISIPAFIWHVVAP